MCVKTILVYSVWYQFAIIWTTITLYLTKNILVFEVCPHKNNMSNDQATNGSKLDTLTMSPFPITLMSHFT